MPKAKKAPAPIQPVAPTPAPAPAPAAAERWAPPNLPILYDKLEVIEYSTASPKGPLEVDNMKLVLGWETESEFKARKVRENPGTKPEAWAWTGDMVQLDNPDGTKVTIPVHCKNLAGEKVICKYNAQNRSFDASWSEDLQNMIMHGQWAGPHTIPGETVNGETIRISKYGRVISGQHQMTACIIADEYLQIEKGLLGLDAFNRKYPAWSKHNHCFLETIVIRGMSEDPRVLMTVDYVKPRSVADVFYTSEVFKNSTPAERRELCKMLAVETDFAWERTAARGYKTHPELVAFLERHRSMLKCVEHLFAENNPNAGRRISKLHLNPGQCAALLFIMATSGPKTDGDVYRNENPPTEKNLDWYYKDRAEEFWVLLGSAKEFGPVRTALACLINSTYSNNGDNQGLGGSPAEKLAILAKAWDIYKDHPDSAGAPFSDDDLAHDGALTLSYTDLDVPDKDGVSKRLPLLPDGRQQLRLLDLADFGGIDCPEVIKTAKATRTAPPEPPPLSKEEMEAAYEAMRLRRGHPPSTK